MILTRQDLSDEQNARDCAAQYRKATDTTGPSRPFKLAEWALEWGEAMLAHLDDPQRDEDADSLDSLATEVADLEKVESRLRDSIERACEKLESAAYGDDASPKITGALEPIIKALENALAPESQ